MLHQIIPVTPFQQNCTLLWCEQSRRAAIVDPGGEVEKILRALHEANVEPDIILLTHGHLDHVGGASELAAKLGLPIHGPHQADRYWLDALPRQCEMFGLPSQSGFLPDRWLAEGESVTFGQQRLDVYHCPGHTPGHLIFYHHGQKLALVGDVLFQGSIGRTDFPGGDYTTLLHSIQGKLWPLGDEVAFIPGHGPMSSFGEERKNNPFVGENR